MNSELFEAVNSITADVRNWTEMQQVRSNGRENLCGFCAIAAAELYRRFEKAGISSEIHMWLSDWGQAHVFVVVDDHVIDVTATQFDEFKHTPVVIMHQREAEAHQFYTSTETFNSVKLLRARQVKQKWPQNQIVFRSQERQLT